MISFNKKHLAWEALRPQHSLWLRQWKGTYKWLLPSIHTEPSGRKMASPFEDSMHHERRMIWHVLIVSVFAIQWVIQQRSYCHEIGSGFFSENTKCQLLFAFWNWDEISLHLERLSEDNPLSILSRRLGLFSRFFIDHKVFSVCITCMSDTNSVSSESLEPYLNYSRLQDDVEKVC